MSELLAKDLTVMVSAELTYPGDILKAVAAQIAPLTGGALQGEVWAMELQGWLATYDFNAIVERKGPGYGLLQVDHEIAKPYPVYVSPNCFEEEYWPPPHMGAPNHPSFKRGPAANNPEEFLALINWVLTSPQVRRKMEFLINYPQHLADSNGTVKNGPPTESTTSVRTDAASTG